MIRALPLGPLSLWGNSHQPLPLSPFLKHDIPGDPRSGLQSCDERPSGISPRTAQLPEKGLPAASPGGLFWAGLPPLFPRHIVISFSKFPRHMHPPPQHCPLVPPYIRAHPIPSLACPDSSLKLFWPRKKLFPPSRSLFLSFPPFFFSFLSFKFTLNFQFACPRRNSSHFRTVGRASYFSLPSVK